MKNILTLLFALVAVLISSSASAHISGFTYETTVGDYFVDVGSNKTELVQNDLILFEYNLYPKSDQNNLADFDNVYVSVGDDKTVMYSGYLYRPDGQVTTMSFAFPHGGIYKMSARFDKGGQTMAEVEFPIEIKSSGIDPMLIIVGIAGLALGLGIGFVIRQGSNHPHSPA